MVSLRFIDPCSAKEGNTECHIHPKKRGAAKEGTNVSLQTTKRCKATTSDTKESLQRLPYPTLLYSSTRAIHDDFQILKAKEKGLYNIHLLGLLVPHLELLFLLERTERLETKISLRGKLRWGYSSRKGSELTRLGKERRGSLLTIPAE